MFKRYLADTAGPSKANISTSPKRMYLTKTASQPQIFVRQSANIESSFKTRSKLLRKSDEREVDCVLLSADLISKLRQFKGVERQKTEPKDQSTIVVRPLIRKLPEKRRDNSLNISHTETVIKTDLSKVKFTQNQTLFTQNFEKQLFVASKTNDLKQISQLLSEEVEADESRFPKSEPSNHTIAHYAAWHGQEKVIEYLLRIGFDLNSSDSNGITPLMLACTRESSSITRILCSMAQNINFQDCDGKTAFHYACEKSNLTMCEILLDHPAIDLSVQNSLGKTALEYASPEIILRAEQVLTNADWDEVIADRIDISLEESDVLMDELDFRKELSLKPRTQLFPPQNDYDEDKTPPPQPLQIGLSARSSKEHHSKLYNETMKIFKTQEQNGFQISPVSSLSKDNTDSNSFQGEKKKLEAFVKKPQVERFTPIGHKLGTSKATAVQSKNSQNLFRNFEELSQKKVTLANPKFDQKEFASQRKLSKPMEPTKDSPPFSDGPQAAIPKLRNTQFVSNSLNGLYQHSKSKPVSKPKPPTSGIPINLSEAKPNLFIKKQSDRFAHERISGDSRKRPQKIMNQKMGIEDFVIHSVIGSGSFGDVYLVEKKDTPMKYYAMKVLDKKRVREENLNRYVLTERRVLSLLNHPFITRLRFAFQNAKNLFLIMDYYPGGNLADYLFRENFFSEQRAKLYIAEIILAIEELHKHDIIYRDLKPENIVLDSEGHALLIDFGLSKEGISSISRGTKSFCGSCAYLAPEMLKKRGHGKSLDWYLLGVVLYEFLAGESPFYSDNQTQLFKNIESEPLRFKSHFSPEVIDLISKLMVRDPLYRLGSQKGAEEIKSHPWFKSLDWEAVKSRKTKPEKPKLKKMKLHHLKVSEHGLFDTEESTKNKVSGWTFIGAPPEPKSS